MKKTRMNAVSSTTSTSPDKIVSLQKGREGEIVALILYNSGASDVDFVLTDKITKADGTTDIKERTRVKVPAGSNVVLSPISIAVRAGAEIGGYLSASGTVYATVTVDEK